jgi:hypothetical protein
MQGYGPRMEITADGKPFVSQSLRDNQEIGAEQLGNYLSRLSFMGTATLPIKADETNADRALVKAKFELSMIDPGKKKTVLTVEFAELRLSRTKSNREEWFLTKEGIELIEQAYAAKEKK